MARRKVEGLLAEGARVTVVAPEVGERLSEYAQSGKVVHKARAYQLGEAPSPAMRSINVALVRRVSSVGDGAVER